MSDPATKTTPRFAKIRFLLRAIFSFTKRNATTVNTITHAATIPKNLSDHKMLWYNQCNSTKGGGNMRTVTKTYKFKLYQSKKNKYLDRSINNTSTKRKTS